MHIFHIARLRSVAAHVSSIMAIECSVVGVVAASMEALLVVVGVAAVVDIASVADIPAAVDAFPCGSKSIKRTFLFVAARLAARLTAVVVLPTPPFWFATVMILFILFHYNKAPVKVFII